MKYIPQFLIILGFTFLGEVLAYVIPFPIPAAIYGLVLMLIALGHVSLKKEKATRNSTFIIGLKKIAL